MSKSEESDLLSNVVALAKRRGFIYQGSEIYGGLAGTWDYGPMGSLLKKSVVDSWLTGFVFERTDVFLVDTAVIMNPKVWEASGHLSGFVDPLDSGEKFNLMFKTSVGAGAEAATSYLRPETAQGMFVNFKNIIDSFHPTLPFGIAQVGKAFRNEIAPRDFLFRAREFEQMEIEYFIRPTDWQKYFESWREEMKNWIQSIGLSKNRVHELEVPEEERAHYSERTIDFEYDFPFGRKELYGLAYRTDFDLSKHSEASGVKLEFLDDESGERFTPHVIEPTFSLDRTVLAILCDSYCEDELGGEKRVFLKLPAHLAPIKVAVFPLLKNKPELVKKAQQIHRDLRSKFGSHHYVVAWDDNGNIGKRYRRQDEIGTPHCVTVDFESLENDTVTVRDRDSGKQKRFNIADLPQAISFKDLK